MSAQHGSRASERKSGAASKAQSHVSAALAKPGRPLPRAARATLEQTFSADLSRVRIHDDSTAREATRSLGARGFAVGRDVFVGGSHADGAGHSAGLATLAHEVTHSLQQSLIDAREQPTALIHNARAEREANDAASAVAHGAAHAPAARLGPALQGDFEEPTRFQQTNDALFKAAPGTSTPGTPLKTWVDPAPGVEGTAKSIAKQAKDAILKDPPKGTIDTKTTESKLDSDAELIDTRLQARFPLLKPVSVASLHAAVSVLSSAVTGAQDYMRAFLANKLQNWTDIETYAISEKDPRFVAMLDGLLADKDIKDMLLEMGSRVAGLQRGDGSQREIFVHRGTDEKTRRSVLIHELVHFRCHDRFTEWMNTTTNPRFFNEGFTEWLARKAMTPDELKSHTSYQDRVDAIQKDVAANVPEDDIIRAYFLGEVWRIESKSNIARRSFEEDTGIGAADTKAKEEEHSRTGAGITQEVSLGTHFRFLNLGHDAAEPKPEHKEAFRDLKKKHLDTHPDVPLRFVGHASTPGPPSYNMDLSRRRVLAFYKLAQDELIAADRMPELSKPSFFGESKPTLKEEDPQTRAFNRRVELFIGSGTAPPGSKAAPGATKPYEDQ